MSVELPHWLVEFVTSGVWLLIAIGAWTVAVEQLVVLFKMKRAIAEYIWYRKRFKEWTREHGD